MMTSRASWWTGKLCMAPSRINALPYVTLVGAMSVDGKISTRTGDSAISSSEDLKSLHRLRSRHDAVMIGVGTLIHDNPILTVRHVRGKSPIRVIVDDSAQTPPPSRMLIDHGPPVIVATARRAPRERVQKLRQAGATVLQLGRDHVSLRTLLIHLHHLGIRRILLEGGGKMNWSMISNRLVDTIKLTVPPIIIGGTCATTLVDGEGVAKINQAIRLTLLSTRRHGKDLVLSYKVK